MAASASIRRRCPLPNWASRRSHRRAAGCPAALAGGASGLPRRPGRGGGACAARRQAEGAAPGGRVPAWGFFAVCASGQGLGGADQGRAGAIPSPRSRAGVAQRAAVAGALVLSCSCTHAPHATLSASFACTSCYIQQPPASWSVCKAAAGVRAEVAPRITSTWQLGPGPRLPAISRPSSLLHRTIIRVCVRVVQHNSRDIGGRGLKTVVHDGQSCLPGGRVGAAAG